MATSFIDRSHIESNGGSLQPNTQEDILGSDDGCPSGAVQNILENTTNNNILENTTNNNILENTTNNNILENTTNNTSTPDGSESDIEVSDMEDEDSPPERIIKKRRFVDIQTDYLEGLQTIREEIHQLKRFSEYYYREMEHSIKEQSSKFIIGKYSVYLEHPFENKLVEINSLAFEYTKTEMNKLYELVQESKKYHAINIQGMEQTLEIQKFIDQDASIHKKFKECLQIVERGLNLALPGIALDLLRETMQKLTVLIDLFRHKKKEIGNNLWQHMC